MANKTEQSLWATVDEHEERRAFFTAVRNKAAVIAGAVAIGGLGGWFLSDTVNGQEHYDHGYEAGYERGDADGAQRVIDGDIRQTLRTVECDLMRTAHSSDPDIYESFDYDACITATLPVPAETGN